MERRAAWPHPLTLAARSPRPGVREPPDRNRSSSSSTEPDPERRRRRCAGRSGGGRARSPGRRARPSGAPAPRRRVARVSSHVAPSSVIRPLRGRRNPATARSTLDLPAPDGPTSASVPASTSTSSSKSNSEGVGEALQLKGRHDGISLTARSRTALASDELGADRESRVEVDVELLVDRERERLGDALERSGEHDGRAELPEPARECERGARTEATGRESGSATRAERPCRACTERPRRRSTRSRPPALAARRSRARRKNGPATKTIASTTVKSCERDLDPKNDRVSPEEAEAPERREQPDAGDRRRQG